MSSEPATWNPTPEHLHLQSLAGVWDVECAYFLGSDEPLVVQGVENAEMLGPFWLVGRFEADMLGEPLNGSSNTGFNPVTNKYVGTWKDSSTPFLFTFEGTMEDEGSRLVMSGANLDPHTRQPATYHSVTEYPSDTERILSLEVESPGGKRTPILTYTYRRR